MPYLRLSIDKLIKKCYIYHRKGIFNMQRKSGLYQKAEKLRNELGNLESFPVSSAKEILGERDSTLYWSLWSLAKKSYIKRIGKGLYSFEKKKDQVKPILSAKAKRAWKIIDESGYQFFISGLDILSVFAEHIPEYFPTLLFVDKYSRDDVLTLLSKNDLSATTKADYYKNTNKEFILAYATNEFKYSQNGLASFEKAFVDLYYEITRNDYSLPLQELARIYLNMKRRLSFDTNRLIKIASRRNIHYDVRYIVDNEYITPKANEFVKFIHGS